VAYRFAYAALRWRKFAYGDRLLPDCEETMLEINAVLTLATLVLAFFSILQARAARDAANEAKRQANALDTTLKETKKIAEAAISNTEAAKKQASLLEKSFLFTHRPKLIVRNVVIKRGIADGKDDPFYENALLAGQFYVQNMGDSRATITESGCWLYWKQNEVSLPGLPMRRPYEGKNGNNPLSVGAVLLPGESLTAIFQSDDYLMTEAQRVREGNWPLYVMGWIEYKDDAGTQRRIAFCRKYDGSKRRFVSETDPDYEHAE
jgi:hypothetical protein